MPTYAIRRTWGAESLQEDPEMGHARIIASSWAEPRFLWIRSFGRVTPGGAEGICIYEGSGERELAVQQRLCGLPVDEIVEVEEIVGASGHRDVDAAPEGWELYLAERHFEGGSAAAVTTANQLHATQPGGATWLRSFWHQGRARSVCIFAAVSKSAAAAALETPAATLERLVPIGTDHPALWAHIYDTMGIPRHWEEPQPAV